MKKMFKKFTIIALCVLFLVGEVNCTNKTWKNKEQSKYAEISNKPNILFFITDDESWVERSTYGWSNLPTPHFDRVAEQGILFTNSYTSAPSSAPSRASILTGRNFWELEQGAFIQAFLPDKFPLFTHLLSENGYYVGNTQKTWGPGNYPEDGHSNIKICGSRFNIKKVDYPIDGINDNDYAANFEIFLKENKADQPFFFWAGVIEPHLPNGNENYKRLEKEYGISLDQIKLFPGTEDTPINRQSRANYIYEICYADQQLGRMLESLEKANTLENTLIVVTSDNGTPVTRDKLVGKASPYDLGVHVPLAIMWPAKVKSGRKVSDFINFADFAPTFLNAAGIQIPESMSGKSIMPQLLSEKSGRIDDSRSFVATGLEWHGEFDPVSSTFRTIRDDNYAYIVRYDNVDVKGEILSGDKAIQPARTEFYDLIKDPWQLNDLIDNPKYTNEKRKLAKKLQEFGMQTKDPRVTGDMEIFIKTRQYVQKRKRIGYSKTIQLPFPTN